MYYTTREVAAMFKVTVQTVPAKKLPAIKIGRNYRITDEDIQIMIDSAKGGVHHDRKAKADSCDL